jgi:hypothetical protein
LWKIARDCRRGVMPFQKILSEGENYRKAGAAVRQRISAERPGENVIAVCSGIGWCRVVKNSGAQLKVQWRRDADAYLG